MSPAEVVIRDSVRLRSDAMNWIVESWSAPKARPDGTMSAGRWASPSFHKTLKEAALAAHERLMKGCGAPDLESLLCAADDTAGAIVAAVGRLGQTSQG